MRSGIVALLCLGGILAGLSAGCAGHAGPGPETAAAPSGPSAAGMRGCGSRPVPVDLELPGFEDARIGADVVFVGRMFGTNDPIPLSVRVPNEDLVLDYGFDVYRIWGGEPADTLWVRAYRDPSSGGISFSKGSVYIIYANREDGQLWTNRCSRTAMITAAYADLYRLGPPDYDAGKDLLPDMDRETLAREARWPERSTRVQALRVMEQIAPEDPGVISVMIEAMNDQKGPGRVDFIAALGRLGPVGKPAVPALVAALDDEDPTARAMAAGALGKVGLVDDRVLPALIGALDDPDPAVRISAAQAIGGLGPDAAEALPALRRLLQDPQKRVRDTASQSVQLVAAGSR